MKEVYPIIGANKSVGTAEVSAEGLYYRIDCYCTQEAIPPQRILVQSDTASVDLGICVSMAGEFVIHTRIAAKKLGQGALSFRLYSPSTDKATFYNLDSDAPFPYITALKKVRFAVQGGKAGLWIEKD